MKQAQTLLNAPEVSTTKGLRNRAILAVLLGCGLRRYRDGFSRTRESFGKNRRQVQVSSDLAWYLAGRQLLH